MRTIAGPRLIYLNLDRVRSLRVIDELGGPDQDIALVVWETHRLSVFDHVGGRLIHGSAGNYGNTFIRITNVLRRRSCSKCLCYGRPRRGMYIIRAFVAHDYPDEGEPRSTPGRLVSIGPPGKRPFVGSGRESGYGVGGDRRVGVLLVHYTQRKLRGVVRTAEE